MNYFKILGLIFGIMALLKPFYMHIIPWDENKFIRKAYSEKRPFWIIPVSVLGLFLVAFTWYKQLTTRIPYSLVLTILFSLTAIKAIFLLFDYQKFQNWVTKMLNNDKGKNIVLIDIGVGILGFIVILISLLVY